MVKQKAEFSLFGSLSMMYSEHFIENIGNYLYKTFDDNVLNGSEAGILIQINDTFSQHPSSFSLLVA